MRKILCGFIVAMCAVAGINSAMAASRVLSGTVIVNVTDETAAAAKNKAMNQARRQIIISALTPYSMVDALTPAVNDASSDELAPLISGTNITGEQSSDTTYSANIAMTIDTSAARTWLTEKNVQNWLNDGTSGDKFTMNITLKNRFSDMAELNKIARTENMDLSVVSIKGGSVVAQMPAANRTGFTIALRDAGWRTADSDGTLMISK